MIKTNIKFLFDTTRGFRLKFCILFLCVVFAALTSLAFPHLVGEIVDTVFYNIQLRKFAKCFMIYVIIYFINQILNGGVNYFYAILKSSYLIQIRVKCFSHLINLKSKVLVYLNSGDVIKRFDTDIDKFLDFIHFNMFFSINDALHLVGAIIFITNVSWVMGIVSIVVIPLMYYISKYFMNVLNQKYKLIEHDKGILSAWIYEIIKGFCEIKLLTAEGKVIEDYMNRSKYISKSEVDVSYERVKNEQLNFLIILLGELFLLGISAYYIVDGKMTIGQFVACETYFSSCLAYYKNFTSRLSGMVSNMVSINRIQEFFALEEDLDIHDGANHIMQNGEILFQNVDFSYENLSVLRSVDFKIYDGEHIAIVGKSGEGKSTIVDLISSIYSIDAGSLKIDNMEISDYSLESLRNQLGVVQQRSSIFEKSIRYNIAFTEDKTVDNRVWEILEIVNMSGIVSEMPQGLDTILGEGGRELSGGQNQKIAIARLLYRKPKILIFDEATSSIDCEDEKEIDMIVGREFAENTTITIAHRFSTIMRSDRILVIDKGKILADGDHDTLLKKCEVYRKLYGDSRRCEVDNIK